MMKIFIQNLDDGVYQFDGDVTAEELAIPEYERYPEAIKVHALVDRLANIFRIRLTITTTLRLICDRCLDAFISGFHEELDRIFQIGSGTLDDDEEVEIIPDGSKEIDLSNTLYEAIVIAQPIRVVCKEDCKGLCAHCGVNLNQKQCSCTTTTIDPRFEKLKLLLKEE
jgi:uncharacterized protein